MRPRLLSDIAATLAGRLHGRDATVDSVATDSRGVVRGGLFVAMAGEHGDGHAFLRDAADRDAGGALVERRPSDATHQLPVVVIPDTSAGLTELATDERKHLPATVLGITGSTGKTCTKDFAAAVLSARFETKASPASFNNEVGLPLTVLSAGTGTEALICEMGSRGIGHIAALCAVARPHIGVVTNVGIAHLGLFGTRENIVQAKAELVEALPADGTAILNADDPVVRGYRDRTRASTVLFGLSGDADIRAEDVDLLEDGRPRFTLAMAGDHEPVELAVPGEHMVSNALAAAACGLVLGMTAAECAAALKGARVSGRRMEVFETAEGVRILNDAYNANPTSMAAALRTARWMSRDGRCVAVLGHMAELGAASIEQHDRIGELVARLGIEDLIVVGEEAAPIAGAAVREGMRAEHVTALDPEDVVPHLRSLVRPGDLVLLKGSRVAALDRVAEALR